MQHVDLATTPAAQAPPGSHTNFVDPPSQQAAMIAVSAVMITLTVVFVFIRAFTNLRVHRALAVEDWLCIVACVFSFSYIGIVLSLAFVSRHMWDVPMIWFTEDYWKYRFAGNTLQALAYFFSRLPILLLFLRLFGRKKSFRIATYVAFVAAFFVYLTSIPLLSVLCTPPLGGDWGSLDVFAKCKKLLPWAMIQGSGDIALNVYILVLPLFPVVGLQMPLKQKLGVLAIFLTGLLAVICSALGLYYRYQLSFTPDVNWNEGAFICMSIVEINIAIICSCMPACASFGKNVLHESRFFTSLRSAFSRFGSSKSSSRGGRTTKENRPSAASYEDMELIKGHGNSGFVVNTMPTQSRDSHRTHPNEGITRTVAVDVV